MTPPRVVRPAVSCASTPYVRTLHHIDGHGSAAVYKWIRTGHDTMNADLLLELRSESGSE